MAKIKDLEQDKAQKVMIFGAPKVGKSQIASELSEFFNLLWIDLENSYEILFKLPEEWQDRIEVISLPDTSSYPIAIETMLKIVKGPVVICDQHGKVACMSCKKTEAPTAVVDVNSLGRDWVVVVDSATQLSNSAVAHITKNQPDDYKLEFDDHSKQGKLLDIFFSHIQQAKYHCVVISHEVEATTEGKKNVLVPVSGTRNFSRNVAKYFGHVVYAERKNKKHVFSSSTDYSTTILSGSRTDAVLEGAEKPSLLAIFKPEIYKKRETEESKVSDKNKAAIATNTPRSSSAAILARIAANKSAANKAKV